MPGLKLKSIQLRNWMTVRSASLEFPASGLVLVTGSNLVSEGKMESIGSGKTALGEAISRVLCAVNGRFSNFGHYSSDSKGNTYIKIEAELSGKMLVVESGYKCKELSKTGEGLRFKFGDNSPVERGHINDTRQELLQTLGITPELAQWSVYIDGDKLKFNQLSEKACVDLLMSALSQPPWTSYHENSAKMLSKTRQGVTACEAANTEAKRQQLRASQGVLSAREDLEIATQKHDQAAKKIQVDIDKANGEIRYHTEKISTLKTRQTEIKKRLKEVEKEKAQTHKELEILRNEINGKIFDKQELKESAIQLETEKRIALNTAAEGLKKMLATPKECPTCKKPWDKVHSADEMNQQEARAKNALDAYHEASAKVKAISRDISELQSNVNEVNQEIKELQMASEITSLSHEYERTEIDTTHSSSAIIQLTRTLSSLEQSLKTGSSMEGVNHAETVLSERVANELEMQKSIKRTAAELVEQQELMKVVAYWHEAFSPTGIPNMVVNDALAPLNSIARRISMLMTGGTLNITYDTTRELASGKDRSELVINVDNKIGSKRVEGSSKGESGLANLIIAETLSEIGKVANRVGYRWYDEILGPQDKRVRQSILSYWKDMAQALGILVFVVDHHIEAANYADYVLIAEKTETGTAYHWKN